MMPTTHHDVTVDGVRLRVSTAGPEDAPPLILLHGWPESGRAWTGLVPFLEEDFRLVIPDQRGFGRSDRPAGTDAYRMGVLVGDVVGLVDWLGVDRVGLVGHDFGGAVCWAVGALMPDRVHRMVVMASPHPLRLRAVGAGRIEQITRAFYVWLMHAGEPGERLLSAGDFTLLSRWAFGSSAAITDEMRTAYREEWAQPGAFHAMAEWYRANYTPDLLNPDVPLELAPVRVPVLYVHPEQDAAFVADAATGSGEFVDAEYSERVVAGTSHWLVHEKSGEVAALIRDWMTRD